MGRRVRFLRRCRGGVGASLLLLALPVACAIDDRAIDVRQNLPADAGPTPDSIGECVSGATACVTSTQRRVCVGGRWSEAESCSNACVGDDCGGVCVPGAQRCASGSQVQRCSDSGEWGAATACPSSCSGDGCVGECTAGVSECFSASQLRLCNERGQWQTPLTCQFACQGSACGGECMPGALRCDAELASAQRCDAQGGWRDAPRCLPGACPEDSVDQCEDVCTSLASDPLNCGSCGHDCLGGACVAGQCQPVVLGGGFTNPSAVALSETHLYFREGAQGAGRVVRLPKAGGELEVVAQGVSNLVGVAIGGEQLYFASGNAATLGQGQVLRADLDGSNLLAFSPLRAPGIFSLIVPGLNVWYTERNAMNTLLYRAPLLSQGEPGAGAEAEFETVAGALASMTVNSGCLFYVAQSAPQQIMRKCAPAAVAEVHYSGGSGEVVFQPAASTDGDYLYFAQGTTLSRIALDPPAGAEAIVSGRVSAPTADADALYYAARLDDTAGGCSSQYALLRAAKTPAAGTPAQLVAPPLACPTQIASDAAALYWVSDDGSALLKLAK
jgi:hypothetical protein